MTERVSAKRAKPETKSEPVSAEAKDRTAVAEALKAEFDALLDEIDEVLEENAEEFVKDYVQKGGQ